LIEKTSITRPQGDAKNVTTRLDVLTRNASVTAQAERTAHSTLAL